MGAFFYNLCDDSGMFPFRLIVVNCEGILFVETRAHIFPPLNLNSKAFFLLPREFVHTHPCRHTLLNVLRIKKELSSFLS